jgi:hypothetical protein
LFALALACIAPAPAERATSGSPPQGAQPPASPGPAPPAAPRPRLAALRWAICAAAAACAAAALARRTAARCGDWRTSEALFAAGTRDCPANAKLHYNLAHVTCGGSPGPDLGRRRRRRCARLYRRAIALAPDFGDPLGALATLVEGEDLGEALALLRAAVDLAPESHRAHKALADVLGRREVCGACRPPRQPKSRLSIASFLSFSRICVPRQRRG